MPSFRSVSPFLWSIDRFNAPVLIEPGEAPVGDNSQWLGGTQNVSTVADLNWSSQWGIIHLILVKDSIVLHPDFPAIVTDNTPLTFEYKSPNFDTGTPNATGPDYTMDTWTELLIRLPGTGSGGESLEVDDLEAQCLGEVAFPGIAAPVFMWMAIDYNISFSPWCNYRHDYLENVTSYYSFAGVNLHVRYWLTCAEVTDLEGELLGGGADHAWLVYPDGTVLSALGAEATLRTALPEGVEVAEMTFVNASLDPVKLYQSTDDLGEFVTSAVTVDLFQFRFQRWLRRADL